MFWRKSNPDTLEAPRGNAAQSLDARAYRPLPDDDLIAAQEAAREAQQTEEEATSAYLNRFDDAFVRLTDTSEKTANRVWAFWLRQEAKRYASPNGDIIGLAWAAAAFLIIGGIGTWILGWRFWMYVTLGAIIFLFGQIGVESAEEDFTDADPKSLAFSRRIAIFYHRSFATAEGTVRNLFGLAVVSAIMAIAIAIIF